MNLQSETVELSPCRKTVPLCTSRVLFPEQLMKVAFNSLALLPFHIIAVPAPPSIWAFLIVKSFIVTLSLITENTLLPLAFIV